MEECFERGAPSWSYITEFGMDRKDHHQGSVLDGLQTSHEAGSEVWDDAHTVHPSNETIALPKCLCANPAILLGFVDDPDYHTYSLAGANRMPQNYLDAGALSSSGDAADFMSQCKLACLKMNSSLWCVPLTLTLTLPLPLTLTPTPTLTYPEHREAVKN